MTHRIEQTADILLKAYFTGNLKHGDACSCAVGNMVGGGDWNNYINGTYGKFNSNLTEEEVKKRLPADLRYTPFELIDIEYAFEGREKKLYRMKPYYSHTLYNRNDPDGFKGLTAVFDLLCNDLDKDYFEAQEQKVNLFQILDGVMPQEVLA